MDMHTHASAAGTIVYDAATVPQVDDAWFDPAYWQGSGRMRGRGGGRGAVSYIESPAGPAVLRHYQRGGMVARVLGDRYLWMGRDATRSVAEFRLLAHLGEAGLPVPMPLAARCVRLGWYYRADLITRRIEGARTLAECLHAGSLDAALGEACGATLARLHRHGVWHADLNAHNVLVADGLIYVIDFDRGRLRTPARAWRESNLRRLRRSLLKLGAARDGMDAFEQHIWAPLLRGYRQALERPAA